MQPVVIPDDEEHVSGLLPLLTQCAVKWQRLLLEAGGQLLAELGLPASQQWQGVNVVDFLRVLSGNHLQKTANVSTVNFIAILMIPWQHQYQNFSISTTTQKVL